MALRSLSLGVLLVVGVSPPAKVPTAWRTLELSDSLGELLESGKWKATARGFRIIALSFLADGCVAEASRNPDKKEAARACVTRCLELAKRTRGAPIRPESDDGLWLTHFALILGAADALGSCADSTLHGAIASSLADRSLRDRHRHVASYTGRKSRWPADQSATLASLARYDRAHGERLLLEPARAWREYVLAKAMDRELELPWSEVTEAHRTSRQPRGCALSWSTRFLREFDDSLARQWWKAYRARFLVERLGLTGFREWGPDRDGGVDVDSGPIVGGVGAAATGLGIAAARAMGDDELAERIERTSTVVGAFARSVPEARGPLPDAIRYLGAQLRR